MTVSLAGRRVLYVAPRFFGYDRDIAAEFERRGAEVVRLVDRPFDTPFMTAVTKIAPRAISSAAFSLYKRTLEEQTGQFDLVFVVNGQTLPGRLLDLLRRHSPRGKFVLYIWDGLQNRKSIVGRLDRYDHVFGFDRNDAQSYGYAYRPLFFGPAFDLAAAEQELKYDVSFIGTAHSDRAQIVHAIDRGLPADTSRFWYLFLQAPWVRRYYALRNARFRAVPPEMFSHVPLAKDTTSAVFRRSRTILDIEHPLQRGLTIRTFETIGAGKKLVTTNRSVLDEDFYDPETILVLDRRATAVPAEFLRKPAAPLAPALRQRYSLAGWMDEILSRAGVAASPAG